MREPGETSGEFLERTAGEAAEPGEAAPEPDQEPEMEAETE
jgi:hypothetical protein